MRNYQHFIAGEHVDPVEAERIDSIDPYRGEARARISLGGKEDAARAVLAAKNAMTSGPWAKITATDRGQILRNIGDAVVRDAERLALIEVRDNGKLLAEMARPARRDCRILGTITPAWPTRSKA